MEAPFDPAHERLPALSVPATRRKTQRHPLHFLCATNRQLLPPSSRVVHAPLLRMVLEVGHRFMDRLFVMVSDILTARSFEFCEDRLQSLRIQ